MKRIFPHSHSRFKPNAGGFGNGIVRYNNKEEFPKELPTTNDQMAVLQSYVAPKQLYRVWFLRGKIQCAVVRHSEGALAACAASATSSLQAHQLSSVVKEEIEGKLLPLIPDAHCGSIEYLTDHSQQKDDVRYYFDVNLLSTLPLVETVSNAAQVWGPNYDPWMELANAILDFAEKEGT
mmetsp:Transcript_24591/g.37944  ORF Transcript_24591/g.37944 Transcript_24591/m.37944 type:complete len:179 (+) Transcript_24591:2-538(+)